MNKVVIGFFVVVGIIAASAFFQPSDKERAILGGFPIIIEIADTPAERERGLSGREQLAHDRGLLFVFEKPGKYGFWMKDMNFSIDIVWLDHDGKIIYIAENVAPSTYPQVFLPPIDALYVLEVSAGFLQIHNTNMGDVLEIKGN